PGRCPAVKGISPARVGRAIYGDHRRNGAPRAFVLSIPGFRSKPTLMGGAVGVQCRAKTVLVRVRDERGKEAVPRQLAKFVTRKVQRLQRGGEIIINVAAEISRVVRIDGDAQSRSKKLL